MVANAHGLWRGHIGAVCDAITNAGIDPQAWTARQISDALNADMRATGSTWPDHIDKPGAFLAWRLRRLTAHNNSSGKAAASLDNNPTATASAPSPRVQLATERNAHAADTARWHSAVLAAAAPMGPDRVLAAVAAKIGRETTDATRALAHAGRMAMREHPELELGAALAAWVQRWAPLPAPPVTDAASTAPTRTDAGPAAATDDHPVTAAERATLAPGAPRRSTVTAASPPAVAVARSAGYELVVQALVASRRKSAAQQPAAS